jgi:hypothetical protein
MKGSVVAIGSRGTIGKISTRGRMDRYEYPYSLTIFDLSEKAKDKRQKVGGRQAADEGLLAN